jgi:DMSO reductase anchor subunit
MAAAMRPGWPDILQTTLSGTAQGLFLVVFLLDALRATPQKFVILGCGISLLLLACGLIASRFRPGRAAAPWRTSWLAREAVALPAFTAMVLVYAACRFLESERPVVLAAGAAAAALSIALFVCAGMVYASRTSVPAWRSPLTLVNFFLLGLASGLTLAVPLAVLAWPPFAGPLALAAFAAAGLAWLARIAALVRNARLRPDLSRPALRAASLAFLVLLFPAPGWLLGWSGGSLGAFAGAFALQFAGLLAERWAFLAEAGGALA